VPELTLRSQLGLGLVGCGRFGEFCLTAFATIPNLKLIGVADRDQRRAEVTASAFGVTAYADYEALLADPDVDAVAIATPVSTHYALARDALACEEWNMLHPEAEQRLPRGRFVLDHDLDVRHLGAQVRGQRVERILGVLLEPPFRIEGIAFHVDRR